MRLVGILQISILAALLSKILAIGGECAKLIQGNMFDLNALKNTTSDHIVPLKNATDDRVDKDLNLYLNFCGPAIKQCKLENNASTKSQIILLGPEVVSPQTQICKAVVPAFDDMVFKTNETIIAADGDQRGGLRILFNNTNSTLSKDQVYFNVQINLLCDKSINANNTKFYLKNTTRSTSDLNLTTIEIEAFTTHACPVYSSNFILEILEKYKYVYVVLAFVIGLVECFYGHKIIKPTLFLVRFLSPDLTARWD